jgi:hypothetical protein
MTQMSRFVALVFAMFALAAPAFADPFRVRDLSVDVQAASGTAAVSEGRAQARMAAAERLIDRLTLPEDRAQATQPILAADVAQQVLSVDTQGQEKITSSRYIATLIVNFSAKDVRAYFAARGVPIVEAQAGKAMIVPATSGLSATAWGAAWAGKSDDTVLTPYVVSAESWDRHPTWNDIQPEVQSSGAVRGVAAEAYGQNGQIYVRLSELRSGTPEATLAVAGPFSDMSSAQAGSLQALEQAWKSASIVRTSGSTSISLVASFADISQWVKIRKGLEASRLISGLNIESLSTRGADISFVYAGRPDQLAADLRSRGVSLRGADNGWLVEAASTQ